MITWQHCCRPSPVCCMRCECCTRMVPRPRRCMIFSVRQLSRAFSMWRQRSRACARRQTARVLTLCCAAANGSVTVVMMCLSSPTCSTLSTMIFFNRVKTNSDHVLQPYLPDQTNIPYQIHNRSHNITHSRECCKGDDESQWERGKFDPPPPKNPLADGHQNLCR